MTVILNATVLKRVRSQTIQRAWKRSLVNFMLFKLTLTLSLTRQPQRENLIYCGIFAQRKNCGVTTAGRY